MVKKHFGFSIFVLVLAAIVFVPPAAHHYVFPTSGDDTARHLEVLDEVHIGQFSYLESNMYHRYGGQTLTAWLRDLSGVSTDRFFLWFNYAVLFCMGLVIYFVVRKLTNSNIGAMLSAFVALFAVGGTMILFGCGTIYNILNMYVFAPLVILMLVMWLSGKGRIYGLLSILGFAWCAVMHCVSAAYIAIAIPIAVGIVFIYRARRKEWAWLKCLSMWGVAFVFVGWLLPYFTLRDTSWILSKVIDNPATGSGIPEVIGGQNVSWLFVQHPSFMEYLVMIAPLTIVIFLAGIGWYMGRKGIHWNSMIRHMLLVLSSLAFVCVCGTFLNISPDNYRFAVDLSIMLAIITGIILANVIAHDVRQRFIWYATPIVVMICLPLMMYWCGYNSCIRTVDEQAIEYISGNGYTSVTVSSQVAPWVYQRFTDGISYVDRGGEIALYRSAPMTYQTEPDSHVFWRKDTTGETLQSDFDGMPLLARFDDGKVEILIYEGE